MTYMTYSPATIANYFLSKGASEGRSLTPMQLIKLVYIAHGWHLGYFDAPLINERVQAWKYGPVIDSLYHELKQYGSGPILQYLQQAPDRDTVISNDQSQALLDHVWDSYSRFNGIQLSTMTHQPETPWSLVWANKSPFAREEEIPDDKIRDHYKQKIIAATRANPSQQPDAVPA